MTFRSLLSLFVLEGLDLTLDWSLFADISTRHDRDPFLSDVCLVIMVFCVIGTLTFVLELYLKYMEISKPESDLNPDVFSAATTWLEDIRFRCVRGYDLEVAPVTSSVCQGRVCHI